jgi:hypothetical protein
MAAAATDLTIDLDDAGILDTSTISALICVHRSARERGCSVALAVSRPHLLEALRVTALDRIFPVVAPETEHVTVVPQSRGKQCGRARWSERLLVAVAFSLGIAGAARSPAAAQLAPRSPTEITQRIAAQTPSTRSQRFARQRFYKSFRYKAASWSRQRRVVAKVECHLGELFPRRTDGLAGREPGKPPESYGGDSNRAVIRGTPA